MYSILSLDIQYLKGVGPVRAKLLSEEIGVHTFKDLLYYFPFKYIDRSVTYCIADLKEGMPYVQLKGEILSFECEGEGRKRRLKAYFRDKENTGTIELVWFKGIKFIQKQLKLRETYIILGKPICFNGRYSFSHPDMNLESDTTYYTNAFQAFYNTTEKMKRGGLTSQMLQKYFIALFERLENQIPETLTPQILEEKQLIPLSQALRQIHFPQNAYEIPQAERRLKFEELFYQQLEISFYKKKNKKESKGFVFLKVGKNFNQFYHEVLPFSLTNAQKRVLKEIRADLLTGKQMNRLVQGDVGSGKTIVALMTMLLAVDNGYQACLMAPTEILAEQHYKGIKAQMEQLNVKVALLTGSVKGKKRETILHDLQVGEIAIVVGTHALIEENVKFAQLGLSIIDEQHRFGVKQRAELWKKNVIPPHILVMTATPIPRTLAMTVYGDLDVSVINELPPGRKPIKTLHYYEHNTLALHQRIVEELAKGHQVYIVYPLIQENEKVDMKSLEEGYEKAVEAFPSYKVGYLHGKMKPKEKEEAMQQFIRKETQILVSTTVIEVGVNVPNASVMVIESANRFGLAQLHQLRGRVGRGAEQSYCLLVTGEKMGENVKKRMQIMLESNDGFEIAEEDLKIRGEGDREGTQQSGVHIRYKIASIRDKEMMEEARKLADKIVDADLEQKHPSYKVLWKELKEIMTDKANWAVIS